MFYNSIEKFAHRVGRMWNSHRELVGRILGGIL